MSWRCFQLTYELLSPLHIGYHKVGHVQRTRYYIPARTVWGAVTARLTHLDFLPSKTADYEALGKWLQEHCAFSYWFLCHKNQVLVPHYEKADALHYGDLKVFDFERQYLCSYASTAIDSVTNAAESGSMHEVELLKHYVDSEPVSVRGWVFMDEEAEQHMKPHKSVSSCIGKVLNVGGERRYGFGRMVLRDISEAKSLDVLHYSYSLNVNGVRPVVCVEPCYPLLGHTSVKGVAAYGGIEPLVGRETRGKDSQRFGQSLSEGVVCWVPGSMVTERLCLEIRKDGIWQKAGG